MHTYQKEEGRWTVGYYLGVNHNWVTLRVFTYEESAAAFANYLNGGDGRIFLLPIGQG